MDGFIFIGSTPHNFRNLILVYNAFRQLLSSNFLKPKDGKITLKLAHIDFVINQLTKDPNAETSKEENLRQRIESHAIRTFPLKFLTNFRRTSSKNNIRSRREIKRNNASEPYRIQPLHHPRALLVKFPPRYKVQHKSLKMSTTTIVEKANLSIQFRKLNDWTTDKEVDIGGGDSMEKEERREEGRGEEGEHDELDPRAARRRHGGGSRAAGSGNGAGGDRHCPPRGGGSLDVESGRWRRMASCFMPQGRIIRALNFPTFCPHRVFYAARDLHVLALLI